MKTDTELLAECRTIIKDMYENGDGANFYRYELGATMQKLKDLLSVKTKWEK